MKKMFVMAAILITVGCVAQNVSSVVKDSFQTNFPGIMVKKWDKEDDGFEANFIKNGKKMSATFSASGELKETETGIIINDLPYAVTNYIETKYNGAHIKEAAIIVRGNDKMYEAEVKGKDLLFTMQGKFIKVEED